MDKSYPYYQQSNKHVIFLWKFLDHSLDRWILEPMVRAYPGWGFLFLAPFILWVAKGLTMTKTWAHYFSWRWVVSKKTKRLWCLRKNSERVGVLEGDEKNEFFIFFSGPGASVEMWPQVLPFDASFPSTFLFPHRVPPFFWGESLSYLG